MSIIVATYRPLSPERFGVVERKISIYGGGWWQVRRTIGEDKRHPFTAGNREIGAGRKVFSFQRDRCSQRYKVRTGDGGEPVFVGQTLDPGHSRAIVETKRQLHPDSRATRSSLDNADDRRVRTICRHEIDDHKGAVPGSENGLQYHRVATVGPRDARRLLRRDRPTTVI